MSLILVIDDDREIRETLGEVLDDAGHTTVLASDGREGLQVLRRGLRPDAIVLDLMMPVMNGWDFRVEQRNDPALNEIPVVVLSASASDPEAICLELGIDTCLTKPSQLDDLLDALAHVRK